MRGWADNRGSGELPAAVPSSPFADRFEDHQ
jgi:hypothetical protein